MARPLPILLAGLLLAAAGEARAGWVQPAGGWYLKLWDRTLAGSKAFDLDGGQVELPSSYQVHAINLYAEYGATRDFTVVLQSEALGFAKMGDESSVFSGLTSVGLRASLLPGPVPLAFELRYGYAPRSGKALAEGSVGDTAFVFRPTLEQHVGAAQLSAGFSLHPLWFRGGLGAVISSGDDVDPALEASLAAGATLSFGLGASVSAVFHAPVRTPRLIDVTGAGNTRYVGVELTLSWWFTEGFGVQAALGTAPNAVSNAATPALSLGVEIRS